MGAILNASINVAAMPKEKFQKGKDGKVWYNFTISINDETRFGTNCWITDSQSKEEREAKIPRITLGNAKVSWIKDAQNGCGKIMLVERDDVKENKSAPESISGNDDLPF
tara:strand:+ start:1229 stop:1558 length:330 start_codon:yes stop_codon:yes gene_type:complete